MAANPVRHRLLFKFKLRPPSPTFKNLRHGRKSSSSLAEQITRDAMPPQSRGASSRPAAGYLSRSTPNLPTLASLELDDSDSNALNINAGTSAVKLHADHAHAISPDGSTDNITSPSEPASIEDFSLDSVNDPRSLSPGTSDDGSREEEEDGHVPNLPPRPMYNHHYSRSHTYLGLAAFAPPFYNRPPTPLPPSPSLTSLLRPNFSSQNSRPTTPDLSSDEGTGHLRGDATGTQTPNSATASTLTSTLRSARPVPRASPKVPTYEYYGFTLYLTSSLAFIVYLLWAFLPAPFLHQLGIYYYPNRWWALAIPAWTVMLVVYVYVALAAYNVGHLTLPLDSVECLVDEAASVAVVDAQGRIVRDERPSWAGNGADAAGASGMGKGGGKKAAVPAKGRRSAAHSRQSSLSKSLAGPELDWRGLWNEGTDAVMDIPLGGVCEILYGGDG